MHRRSHRLLGTALVACVPVLGMVLASGPAASASPAHVAGATPSARAVAAARSFIEHLKIGQHTADQRVAGHATEVKGLTQEESTNWSGYADTGSGFTTVKSSWIEPKGTCGSATSLAAFWVGLDGFTSTSQTVEQDGTIIECSGGTASYFDWWEMFPTNAVQVVHAVSPGDVISSSVVRSGTSYKLTVTDSTHSADSFSTTQTCTDCANSSAEWIAEAPCCVSGTNVYPLTNFGVWNPYASTAATTSKSGVISSFTDTEITMVDNSMNVKAKPGPLSANGKHFGDTWERAN
jgi:hypothetical protein